MIHHYTEIPEEQFILDLIHQKRQEFERSIQPLLDQLAATRRARDNVFPMKYIPIDWKPGQPYVSIGKD